VSQALVLCAGFGTRLRPLTDELPKPLLPFGDRSLLEHAVSALRAAGFDRLFANTHHLHGIFVSEIERLGIDLQVEHELRIRGTAGGIAGVRSRLAPGPLAVLNGDGVFAQIPSDFADRAANDHLLLAVLPRAAGEGTVGIGEGGRVVRLRGQRFGEELSGGDYIGLCALGERGLGALPDEGCLVQDFALPLLRRGELVRTEPFPFQVWLPGDDLEGYLSANLAWLSQRVGGGSSVGAAARIGAGVELAGSIVGAGAELAGCGRVEQSLIFAGARAAAPLSRSIVTRAGRVVTVPAPSEAP
jgi:mannose-1-phosphate guanylyltransferase